MSYRVLCFACGHPFWRPLDLAPDEPAMHCPACTIAGELGAAALNALERYDAGRPARLGQRAQAEFDWSEECGQRSERRAERERRERGVETIKHGALS